MGDIDIPPPAPRALLFYSYAEPDEPLRADLEKHLTLLQRQHGLIGWHSRLVLAGTDRQEEAERHLREAQVILLLLSADYLACHDVEAQRALERHRRAEAWLIPVLLRPTDLHGSPFGQLQALPSNARPVTLWRNRDQAWVDVAQGIRRAIAELPARTPCQGPLAGVEQDEAGAPLYLCSELLGFTVPLRLSLDRPAGVHLDRIVRGLALPPQMDLRERPVFTLRYDLICNDQPLFRAKTLSQQGVRGGDVLTLQVRATSVQRHGDEAIFRQHDPAAEHEAIDSLRRELARAGW